MSNRTFILTPDVLMRAYAVGIFPMAESAESRDLRWFDPPIRAVIPLDSRFHVPTRLRRKIRHDGYQIKINTSFSRVMRECGQATQTRPVTWINKEIMELYALLHWQGHAHSIEVWDKSQLIGGLYGVAQGKAFFGESMFSRRNGESQIALVHLVALLRALDFTLLDTQFQTEHLARFGTYEITRANYHLMLEMAIHEKPPRFALPRGATWDQLLAPVLQPISQIS